MVQTSKAKLTPKEMKIQSQKEAQLVKGKFVNLETPGGKLEFPYGPKYFKEEGTKVYSLEDGHVYDLPLGVAHHLNNNCYHIEYEHIKGESFGDNSPFAVQGVGTGVRVKKKVHRFQFLPLDYFNPELSELTQSNLVTVE
jgi:hypothetical protein